MPVSRIIVKLKDGHQRILSNVRSWHFTATGNWLVVERLTDLDNCVVTKMDVILPEDLETFMINRDEIAEVSIVAQVDKPSKVIHIRQGGRKYRGPDNPAWVDPRHLPTDDMGEPF